MNRNKIVVVGGGGHAKVIISILIKLKKFKIIGYTDKVNTGNILGFNYLGNDDILGDLYNKKKLRNAAIGIGQLQNVHSRRIIVNRLIKIGFEIPPIISPKAIINKNVTIGDGTVIMDGVVINTGTEIQKYCIINTNSSVDHDCKIGDFVHIAPGVTICGGVQIGMNTIVGAGTSIIQNRIICENSIIGAGAVVINNCLKPGTYMGIPANILR